MTHCSMYICACFYTFDYCYPQKSELNYKDDVNLVCAYVTYLYCTRLTCLGILVSFVYSEILTPGCPWRPSSFCWSVCL